AKLFAANGITLNASNPVTLVLFPEMDTTDDVPEITEKCWDILGVSPDNLMCSSSRMVVKHKGADALHVMACTLVAYEEGFRMGPSLSLARTEVSLNHPHCASFCVLGGGSCSK
ncbi:MAG: radical SAM protein, partial [Alphaproteobacteria bacterium]|nr:radical SAM protein [Alphaproteobacteria bacterium]